MSNHFALSDIRDPLTFLAGARIPLTLAVPMATWQRYEWISDRLLVRLCSDGAWVERDEKSDWNLYLMDLSDPDVARWCDRKIGEAFGFINYEQAVFACNNGWTFWFVGDECPWFLSDQRPNINRLLADISCTDANIPIARAVLLRALFGVSNV